MSKKLFVLVTVVVGLLLALIALPIGAQEDNKCFDEWDCGDGSTAESQYLWEAGWCAAQIEAGVTGGTVEQCTSSPDDDLVGDSDDGDDDDLSYREKIKEGQKDKGLPFVHPNAKGGCGCPPAPAP